MKKAKLQIERTISRLQENHYISRCSK